MGRAPEPAPAVSAAPSSSSSSSSSFSAHVPPRAPAFLLGPLSPREPMASSEEDGAGNGSLEEKEAGRRATRRRGWLTTAWLIFYNIAMTAGWLVLAVTMARFYLENGTHKGLYKSVQKILKFFQTFALLEIIHCAVGLVHTSVLVTGVQVSSRIFMVWFITHSIKQIQNEESVVLFLVVWTVTEITRYSFYTFNMLNHLPYFIKWARYNFFIILYPVGVVGELLTIYAALPYVKRSGMFSVRLPNKYNVSFDYYYFLLIVMASYVPLFPQLYFHMLRQRRKVLHGEVIVEKDD